MKRTLTALVLMAVLITLASGQDASPSTPSLLKAAFGKLPIYFVENQGVHPEEVLYYVQGADKTLLFTKDGITFRLKGKDRDWIVKLDFVGANPDVNPRGEDRQEAVFSYFKGPEKDWKTGLPTFAKVVYEDLWPGIDLVYMGTVNRMKYEFLVEPGADPGEIRLAYRGTTSVILTERGALRVGTPVSGFEDAPPVAYQEMCGKRLPVELTYDLESDGVCYGFHLGDYDAMRPLVIDPAILVYCGYVGGGDYEDNYGVAVDSKGNAYVTGETESNETTHQFPVAVGPILKYSGNSDAYVAKIDRSGKGLVYCGYIGGTDYELGEGIAVDAQGNACVVGHTESNETTEGFPVKGGPDLTFNGPTSGGGDAFVAKIDPSGKTLVYCGYIGGALDDYPYALAVDLSGGVYVAGNTVSTEATFPVKVGPDLTYNGGTNDAFVAKVNPAGTALDYCGYIGGSGSDLGWGGIAVDTTGSAYVVGETQSTETTFPVKVGPDLTHNGGADDIFVAKVNPQGSALVYCGFIGGAKDEDGSAIAVDSTGCAYVAGHTASNETTDGFPVKVGPDLTFNGPVNTLDAFVAKVSPQGSALVYCGYIGGIDDDWGWGIGVDNQQNAYVSGGTDSDEKTFPVKIGPDLVYHRNTDAFITRVNVTGSGLDYCGYIGGQDYDESWSMAVDAVGNAFVGGDTDSDETTHKFPVTVGPDLTYNQNTDSFIAKVAYVNITVGGSPRPGKTVTLHLTATGDSGLAYQVGSSLGNGPLPVGQRTLGLSPDTMLVLSVSGHLPQLFSGYVGLIAATGQAQAAIHIPNIPPLVGIRIYSAFVTLDPAAPLGIRSISNTAMFTITR